VKAGVVLLAAGRATRMGANKLVADLRGKPVLAHAVDAVTAAGLPPPIVVLGHEATATRAAVERRPACFVIAPDHAEGIARSLAAGIAAVPADWDAAIVCLGDMPRLSPALLRALAARARPDVVIVPCHEGVRGNPVLWGRAHFSRLAALRGDIGGRALLAGLGDAVVELDWGDDSVRVDLDTQAALAAERVRGG